MVLTAAVACFVVFVVFVAKLLPQTLKGQSRRNTVRFCKRLNKNPSFLSNF
jgi:hypothetical protein